MKTWVKDLPVSEQNLPYYMREWWVNYQYQHEFNPLHDHTGAYSFVNMVKRFQQNLMNRMKVIYLLQT